MAKVSSITIGRGRGSLGNVTLKKWKTKTVASQKIEAKDKYEFNAEQEAQQARFRLVGDFLRRIDGVIMIGYRNYAKKMTQYNAAQKYHLANAVQGSGTLVNLDWTKVRTALGNFVNVANPQATANENHTITVTWTSNPDTGLGVLATDKVFVTAYNSDKKVVINDSSASRSTATLTISHPSDWAGDSVHVYVFTTGNKKNKVSEGYRIGEVTAQ